jgi:hypothetical protein
MSKIINPRQTTRLISQTLTLTQYMANSVLEHYNPLAAPLLRTQHAQNALASYVSAFHFVSGMLLRVALGQTSARIQS